MFLVLLLFLQLLKSVVGFFTYFFFFLRGGGGGGGGGENYSFTCYFKVPNLFLLPCICLILFLFFSGSYNSLLFVVLFYCCFVKRINFIQFT